MIHEFSRTELLLGPEAMEKLNHSSVAVFGVGGVGSHAAEALARCGVGCLILIDSDTVSITNINRQSIALHSTAGQLKTRVMKQKIGDICPHTKVIVFEDFVLPENLDSLFSRIEKELPPGRSVDYILDAIDTVSAKLALAAYSQVHKIPLIASMGTGNKLHPELFQITDISKTSVCPLCRVMRRELKSRGISRLKVCWSPEKPLTPAPAEEDAGARRSIPGSVSFVPPAAGLILAGHVIRELAGIPTP